jgi:hypothetical protein
VVDGTLGETAARRQPGMSGADDDRRNVFDCESPKVRGQILYFNILIRMLKYKI